jgi:hypothetical protein
MKTFVSWFLFSLILWSALFIVHLATGNSRELYPWQYAQVDPKIRDWFDRQRAPSGVPCCSNADGTRADERRERGIRYTQFTYTRLVRGQYVETRSEWMEVPESVVIRGGDNPTGNPVVWYYTEGTESETVRIRCYKPATEG